MRFLLMAVLSALLLVTAIAVGLSALVLIGAWVLTWLVGLTFVQTTIVSAVCVLTILYTTQRPPRFDSGVATLFIIFVPFLLYLVIAGLSWLMRLVTPLGAWETALLSTVTMLCGSALILGQPFEIDLDDLMDDENAMVYTPPKKGKKSRRRR